MAQQNINLRHFSIIHFLKEKEKAVFEEIENYLQQQSKLYNYDLTGSKRTFQRDILAIESLYHITIACDRKDDNKYYIKNSQKNNISDFALQSFEIFTTFNSDKPLQSYISITSSLDNGSKHLFGLLYAIQKKLEVSFTYSPISKKAKERTVYPLGLKEYKNNWHLLAYDTKKESLRIFKIGRISELSISKSRYSYKLKQPIDKFLQHSLGVSIPKENDDVKEVILSFTNSEREYIKAYPLHPTQQVIVDNDEELQIGLNIYITEDFTIELLKHAGNVKIIAPNSLKKAYTKLLKKGLEIND